MGAMKSWECCGKSGKMGIGSLGLIFLPKLNGFQH